MSEELTYITPRLAIIHNDLDSSIKSLVNNHGSFFYLFDLSSGDLDTSQLAPSTTSLPSLKVVRHKNRGFPFSFKIALQLCMQMDRFFYKGTSNTVAFYCPQNQFACCVIVCYLYVSGRFKHITHALRYFQGKYRVDLPERWLLNFEQLFDDLGIVMPPTKILKKVVLNSQSDVVPLFEVQRQSRFQQLESVYQHPIEGQLEEHYHHIQTANFHTKKPQTNFVFKPVVLVGDFKIDLFSYESMKPVKLAAIGFNTLFIDDERIVLESSDIYQSSLPPLSTITLQFDDYCKCQSTTPLLERCMHCQQELKPLKKEYTELMDLSGQFNRNRKKQVSSMLVFGSEMFDDVKEE